MMLVRPVKTDDLSQLYSLASQAGIGLTTLPADEDYLSARIDSSIRAFGSGKQSAGDNCYLLVIENTETKKVLGTSGIIPAIGTSKPFYTYKLNTIVKHCPNLNIYNQYEILTLTNDFTGSSELCSLFLSPDFRGGGNGLLLSKSRFLMIANQPQKFSHRLIAEMRGVSDKQGDSPFWQSIGRHFFKMDFAQADKINGQGQQQFIAELMPQHPVHVSLLSKKAQMVIGKVHQHTEPALKILQQEGFEYRGYVDIFDAGPTIEANTEKIASIKQSFLAEVKIAQSSSTGKSKQLAIVANTNVENFRSCLLKIDKNQLEANQLTISAEVADALLVDNKDKIRVKCY